MQIIKDKQIIDNTWTFVDDESELIDGDIVITLPRWIKDRDTLLSRTDRLGIHLEPADNTADIADDLNHFELIEVNFPVFTDGRAFSHARLLRDRYHYQGEIRATGNFMVDQIFYLTKVGVNAFELNDESLLPLALAVMDDFSADYRQVLFAH